MNAGTEAGEALRARLAEAHDALAGGDAVDAERRAKAITALVRAERDVAELIAACAPSAEDNEEGLRAELRRRLERFTECDRAGGSAGELAAALGGVLPT